ncbi:hypothetical protein G0Q06_04910 [Puniceicoccales bacterium CK1056]|uniref:Uncharacterized protein n=1 Tax=Oceanipulchritudo coccoides TaxID=2706888 RepID=A0A6B2M102_9BACT|nr:beta-propeller domain-containing protein [Oceanipulchritudo coccoides]NDV61784.1 hypothetical protein [Oceanipulchritudo coccoides]
MKVKCLYVGAALWMVGQSGLLAQTNAVEVRVSDAIQQVRVEALDSDTGRWLAIASGYRDHTDSGWLKIALPEEFETHQLRVMGTDAVSPFAGKMESARSAGTTFVAYPPSQYRGWGPEAVVDANTMGTEEPVIEEADIWAWNGPTLYFYNQYRGLQVIDLENPLAPEWQDYFRYPARGEDLYAMENGRIILIGTGNYWSNDSVALQFLQFDGSEVSLDETVELEAGQYLDSRRYGDYLYVMTREWRRELNPNGQESQYPLIRLYTVALGDLVAERVVDVQTFASNGWLDAVLTAQPDGILLSLNKWENRAVDFRYRWRSEVHVLVPGADGVPELVGVAPLAGIVHDKFKMNFRNGLLTTVSQQADWTTGAFSRVTKLENFALGDSGFTKVGSLDLAPGETLFATRFYEDTVYVVTFEFVDPLFAIDNSIPSQPKVVGELIVPGWSNYIEWVDDQLFAVGIEERRLTVSIFDVADPTNMSLKSRVNLSEDSWAFSEAQYDDQAISFFPEKKLLMLPFSSWSWEKQEQIQAMQLISWDDTGLQLRGAIQHIDVPRRGTLLDSTVVTVSGREVVTTDINDPDLPVEGGKATLAWNVSRLIPHEEYLLQLETPSANYWGYWRSPYDPNALMEPILFVTSKDSPNIPAAEVPLAAGRLLGAVVQSDRLLLLQDVTVYPEDDYWNIPEKQDIVARLYSLADPLNPVLMNEDLLSGSPYLGGAFVPHQAGDSVIWSSSVPRYDYFIDFRYDAIWPGPYLYGGQLSYLVTEYSPLIDMVKIGASHVYATSAQWSNASSWFWEEPLLIASMSEYVEYQGPDGYPEYQAKNHLIAVDFTIPSEPLQLARAKIPADLRAVEAVGSGREYFLYFEPDYRMVETWAWDGAIAFPLFKQILGTNDPSKESSYTLAWMPPFHLRSRYLYLDGEYKNSLEVWIHNFSANRFFRLNEFDYVGQWLGNNAVLEPFYLQSTNETLDLFKGDAQTKKFEKVASMLLDIPYYYGLELGQTILDANRAYVPFGLYGVETFVFDDPLPLDMAPRYQQLEAVAGWRELSGSSWQIVTMNNVDNAGVLNEYNWLYRPDSMRELDAMATDLGDFNRESAWFGRYAHAANAPEWISHVEHGALYSYVPDDVEAEGLFLLYHDFGIVWTHPSVWPFFYSYQRDEWIHYVEASATEGHRWFYGLSSGWMNRNK